MTVQALIHDLLRWIPKGDRTGALREVLESRQELGDHESVQALAAVLREREVTWQIVPFQSSTTWTDGEGEG